MFNDRSENVFNIVLPASTVGEVAEWFEIMDARGELTTSLIDLVYEKIKSDSFSANAVCSYGAADSTTDNTAPELQSNPLSDGDGQKDFLQSLYDWQGSSSAAFKEEKEERKVRKKMLYV